MKYNHLLKSKKKIYLNCSPGQSPHESGLAIDISNYSKWIKHLEAHKFKWYISYHI